MGRQHLYELLKLIIKNIGSDITAYHLLCARGVWKHERTSIGLLDRVLGHLYRHRRLEGYMRKKMTSTSLSGGLEQLGRRLTMSLSTVCLGRPRLAAIFQVIRARSRLSGEALGPLPTRTRNI